LHTAILLTNGVQVYKENKLTRKIFDFTTVQLNIMSSHHNLNILQNKK